MTFTSTAIAEASPQRYEVTGDLSVNGITHSEILTVNFNGMETYPLDGSVHAGFEATGTITREDHDLDFNVPPRRWRLRHRRPDRRRTRSPAPRPDGMNSQRPNSRLRRTCL